MVASNRNKVAVIGNPDNFLPRLQKKHQASHE